MSAIGSLGMRHGGGNLDIVRYTKPYSSYPKTSEPAPMEAWNLQWYWCAHQFDEVVASPAGVKQEQEQMQVLDLVRTEGRLYPDNYDGRGIASGFPIPNRYVYQDGYRRRYIVDNTDDSDNALFRYVVDAFSNELTYGNTKGISGITHPNGSTDIIEIGDGAMGDVHQENLDKGVNLGRFLYSADLEAFTENVARTLTLQVRQAHDANGDNVKQDAKTSRGEAFSTVSYYRVRWAWLVPLLIETILATALLPLTLVLSRGYPVLKDSQLALMSCSAAGLNDVYHDDDGKSEGPAADPRLMLKNNLKIQLQENEHGHLAFQRPMGK